jgi:hypothetical protein
MLKKFLINKFQFRKFKNKKSLLLFLIGVLTACLVLVLIAVVFGLDQKLINTSLSGYIYDENKSPIPDAQITFQGTELISDSDGYYNFSDIKYGTYDIKLQKNGYNEVTETLRISRFSNYKDFTMISTDFGELLVNFISSDSPINFTNFSVFLNDQQLNLSENNNVNSGRILTGIYTLKIDSAYYKNIHLPVEIDSGTNNLEIELHPASEIFAELKDLITGEDVVPDEVLLEIDNISKQLSDSEILENKIQISDILVPKGEINILIRKNGYLNKKITMTLNSGINSLDNVYLTPNGRISQFNDDSNQFTSSNFDLSEKRSTTVAQASNCVLNSITSASALYNCNDQRYFTINTNTGDVINSVFIPSTPHKYLSIKETLYFVSNEEDYTAIVLVDEEKTELVYITEETIEITSIGITRNDNLLFTTTDAVYRTTPSSNIANKILDGKYLISDVSPNQDQVLLSLIYDDKQSSLWLLDARNLNLRRFTFLPGTYSKPYFISNTEVSFLKQEQNNKVLYYQQINSTNSIILKDNVNDAIPIKGTGIIITEIETDEYLISIQTKKLTQIGL